MAFKMILQERNLPGETFFPYLLNRLEEILNT